MTNRQPDAGVTQRLQAIAATRPLATIARDTGTPFASVHRFMSGGRVPSEFCGALAQAYGISGDWLLTGRGQMFQESRAQADAAPAGDILQLIESMNALSNVRLGVLDGRHHARVLRDLSDTLERYEALQTELNKRSANVLKDLAQAMQIAIDKVDHDRAHDLQRSGLQVLRLCKDEAAAVLFHNVKTRLAFNEMDWQGALESQQRLMRDSFVEGRFADDDSCFQLARTVMAMAAAGRVEDAQRLFEAGMILAQGGNIGERFIAHLAWVGGRLYNESLNVRRSLQLVPLWWPIALKEKQGWMSIALQAKLIGGEVDLRECVKLVDEDRHALVDPIEFCIWGESRKDGDFLLGEIDDGTLRRVRDDTLTIAALKLLLRGSPRRRRPLHEAWAHLERTHVKEGKRAERVAFYGAIIFARHGDRRRAETQWKRMIPLVYEGQELTAVFRAAAHRVTLRLFGRGRKQRKHVKAAHQFFQDALNNGCEAFRAWYEAWLEARDLTAAR